MIHVAKQIIELGKDLMLPTAPEQLLQGKKLFRPLMKHQNAWLQHIHPGDVIDKNISPWVYLQKYMIPLIQKHASSFHLKGIEHLELNKIRKPDFNTFRQRFYEASNGFDLEPVTYEITPIEYFTLIKKKRFPCIERLRDHNELFCANEPDFWHEAIGHIAPLCFDEVQRFYLETAERFLAERSPDKMQRNKSITWTIMEYGFIKEKQEYKMFGAALVGSHLANMRYLQGLLNIKALNREEIIAANNVKQSNPIHRDKTGKLLFYSLDRLEASALFDD